MSTEKPRPNLAEAVGATYERADAERRTAAERELKRWEPDPHMESKLARVEQMETREPGFQRRMPAESRREVELYRNHKAAAEQYQATGVLPDGWAEARTR